MVKNVVEVVGALTEAAFGEAEVETVVDSEVEEAEIEAILDQEKWIPGRDDFSRGVWMN